MEKEMKLRPAVWTRLPEDIQLRVALKLPARELFLAKLVCKSWAKSIACSKAYVWRNYLMIRDGSTEVISFHYLQSEEFFREHIIASSRGGLLLLHYAGAVIPSPQYALVVTNPFTKRLHGVPYIMPPGCHQVYSTRIYAGIQDTPESFKLLLVLGCGHAKEPVRSFHVQVYKPETWWKHAGLINLEGQKMVVLSRTQPQQPVVFDGEALYFLTVPSSSTFRDSGEYYTLNRVRVGDEEESCRLEKLVSWDSLPLGMWPANDRVHPRLVLCSGQLLLVGTSFTEGGKQGPIVFLVLDWETRVWKVLAKVDIDGYVARPLGARQEINTRHCPLTVCSMLQECFCYEDYMVTGLDDEVILSFPYTRGDRLQFHWDRSLTFSYKLSSRTLSRLALPEAEQLPERDCRNQSPGVRCRNPEICCQKLPVSRKDMVRLYLSAWGRIPENTPEQLRLLEPPEWDEGLEIPDAEPMNED